jgi:hypothetical protein
VHVPVPVDDPAVTVVLPPVAVPVPDPDTAPEQEALEDAAFDAAQLSVAVEFTVNGAAE